MAQFAAINQIGVQRIRRHVAVFLGADGMPLAHGDLAVIAAARHARGARLLLAAVHPVGEAVVGRHVIELRRGLVVPAAPRLAAVDGDDGALIAGDEDDARVPGIDPDTMVVIATGRAAEGGERLAAVAGLPRDDVGDVDDVRVAGIDLDLVEVAVAAPQPRVGVDAPPRLARVVGAVHAAAARRADNGVDALAVAGRDPQADPPQPVLCRRQARADLPPRRAAVGGFIETVVGRQRP